MSKDSIARVRYFKQQHLRTQDFTAEQAYHVEMRRRHNIAHHSWGIVNGLEIKLEEDGIFVQPGFAIDGYGRELVLDRRVQISDKAFKTKNSNILDVWLYYNRTGSDKPPKSSLRCDEKSLADYYRWNEDPIVRTEKHDPGVNARKPKTVPNEDLEFAAHRSPPDNPVQDWPVYLGALERDLTDPENPVFTVDTVGRPSVGLVGHEITSPSNQAKIAFQSEFAKISADSQTENNAENQFKILLKDANSQWQEHFTIKNDGEASLVGQTQIHGDLTLSKGALKFEHTDEFAESLDNCGLPQDMDQANNAEAPWRLYRFTDIQEIKNETVAINQLRIEMAEISSSSNEKNQVTIGAWSPDEEAFKPILTVGNVQHPEGLPAVTVHGDLIVKGSIKSQDITRTKKYTEEASSFLTATYSSGVSGANSQFPAQYDSPFEVEACDITIANNRATIINGLTKAQNSDHLRAFMSDFLGYQTVRNEIIFYLQQNPENVKEFINLVLNEVVNNAREAFTTEFLKVKENRDEVVKQLLGDDYREALIGKLLEEYRADVISGLLADEYRPEVIAELLGDNYRSEVITELLGDDYRAELIEPLVELHADEIGAELANKQEKFNDAVEAAIENTENANPNPVGQFIVNTAVDLDIPDPDAAITDILDPVFDPNEGNEIARNLLLSIILNYGNTTNENIVGKFLAVPDNVSLIPDVVSPILAVEVSRDELINIVLNNENAPAAVGAYFGQLNYTDSENQTKLIAVLTPVIDNSGAISTVVQALLDDLDGPSTIGTKLTEEGNVSFIEPIINNLLDEETTRAKVAETTVAHGLGMCDIVYTLLEYQAPEETDPQPQVDQPAESCSIHSGSFVIVSALHEALNNTQDDKIHKRFTQFKQELDDYNPSSDGTDTQPIKAALCGN